MNKREKISKTILSSIGILIMSSMIMLKSTNSYANLNETLLKYCVPKDGYCANKATFQGDYFAKFGGCACFCSQCGTYYNTTTRSCTACQDGTYVTTQNATSCITATCPDGYTKKFTKGKSVCPDGYYGKVLSNC